MRIELSALRYIVTIFILFTLYILQRFSYKLPHKMRKINSVPQYLIYHGLLNIWSKDSQLVLQSS